MDLILMRHGRAEERLEFAKNNKDDARRPLTEEGRKRLSRSLPGLQQLVTKIDLVVTSPLLRARQTAELVVEKIPAPLQEISTLAPGGDFQEITRWLGRQKAGVMLLVGHEPDLGALASWYLTGSEESFITLKKGGVVVLRFSGKPAPATGSLQMLLSSAQLRQLAP
jgi:phosphohistidine phosphatase